MNSHFRLLTASATLLASFAVPRTARAGLPPDNIAVKVTTPAEVKGRALLADVHAKMLSLDGLAADFESNRAPDKPFEKTGEITLARPDKFSVVSIGGIFSEDRHQVAVCDGSTLTRLDRVHFVGYQKPVHEENFFFGQNFLVQLFFDKRAIDFYPRDPIWGRAISIYDTNAAAYGRDLDLAWIGQRTLDGVVCDVVEIKYNTWEWRGNDIREQVCVGPDKYVHQMDTYFNGEVYSQKFRNFRENPAISAETFAVANPGGISVVATDPVRLSAFAPDFDLPGLNGGRVALKQLLEGKTGLLICVLDPARARNKPDTFLPEMKTLQTIKSHFQKQGIGVVCIFGGPEVTPGLIGEMKRNWLPDTSRFDFPIAVDLDPEKNTHGATAENYLLGGRGNILLDGHGKVVFAAKDLVVDEVNQLAFDQAIGQLGVSVSDADYEAVFR